MEVFVVEKKIKKFVVVDMGVTCATVNKVLHDNYNSNNDKIVIIIYNIAVTLLEPINYPWP